jgi:catechol 2,3-dioxygenase-like lactoylglutathione lyase family enzyme
MNLLFVSGIAPIVSDLSSSLDLYRDGIGIPLDRNADYPATDDLDGVRHFGLWTLSGAAQACFGRSDWPAEHAVPQASIEFEVGDVDEAAAELVGAGHTLLVEPHDEPWGQRVARLLSADGLLVGLSYTPWMRDSTT